MKCRVCNYSGKAGTISQDDRNVTEGYGNLVGHLPQPIGFVGDITIDVCPICGTLSSTMNGKVKKPQD
jgi:hypothetical protein